MANLQKRLGRGDIILIDGGTGTEIQRRGVPMDNAAWCGAANKHHSGLIRQMQIDYIDAGAEVITTNAFGTARHCLEPAGYTDEVEELNRMAVSLAWEARDTAADRAVSVAASMSSMPRLDVASELPPTGQVVRDNYRGQAELLAEAGADIIITQMMLEPLNTRIVMEAALETSLPVWNDLSAEVNHSGVVSGCGARGYDALEEVRFEELVKVAAEVGGQVAGVMHSRVPYINPGLEILKRHWDDPLLAYTEIGKFENPDWVWEGSDTPEACA